MRSLILWVAVFAMAASIAAEKKKIVCYFGSWATYRPEPGKFVVEDIDAKLCTHILYGFTGVSRDHEIHVVDSWQDLPNGLNGFGRFLDLKKKNPEVKTMVSIGGYSVGSTVFSDMASKLSSRAKFIRSVLKFLNDWKFDGVYVDWQYPAQGGGHYTDKSNFSSLLKELKQAFAGKGYILSAGVAGPRFSASQSYDIPEISKYLDFISLMTYDFHGSWEDHTGHLSPLYHGSTDFGSDKELTVNASVDYWLSQGAPVEKLVLGVPFYGRSFTLRNPENNKIGAGAVGPGKPGRYTKQPGTIGYNEICEQRGEEPGAWAIVNDLVRRVPYTYRGDQWIGYENVGSVWKKAVYAYDNRLGGAMAWSIDTDDFRGICGSRYPLLNTIKHVFAS